MKLGAFTTGKWAGWPALCLVAAATALAFGGLIGFNRSEFDWSYFSDPYFLAILRFTLLQATLSAVLSVALAWPMALALSYLKDSTHKRAFLSLCVLCFVMPTLIVITGIISLLGRSGSLSPLLGDDWNLYGLSGILIAHIYLNLPFAVRTLYLRLQSIPDASWRLARQLKFTRAQRFWRLEWAAAHSATWLLLGFIFVICFNSFAVVLALGGGPKATTLEVAIYQALKYDFNISEALALAWVQLLIAGSAFLLVSFCGKVSWLSPASAPAQLRPPATGLEQLAYRLLYLCGWLFLLAPLLALTPRVVHGDVGIEFWRSLSRPLLVTLGLGVVSTVLSISLAYSALRPYRRARMQQSPAALWLDWLTSHSLAVPAMVLSVGLFVLLLPHLDLDHWGIWLVAVINGLITVPFAASQLKPALLNFDSQYHRLALSLKLTSWERRRIEWSYMAPAIRTAAAFVGMLAMGDVAIYSIFGNQDFVTLPWLIYGYASTYRLNEASLASMVFLGVCGLLIFYLEKQSPRHA
ncbi:thiamine/thiamine pyrophosphate ABC transporter permease ThiP [Hahella aquimaris]|uniref:thiamine/thiamine pyrophosphate ABC transporter permease ThiP n=1 Tax=Hahella sp. HNIBRBA332 TaxID=3015983 RepID=UPI00273B390B|nr:thiamine/thiamine pyrophosphate ABC transporter permease ThiP [Hahella sp. HNIBRBA332]WLQ11665.1 thiamine/thiamine pyrophosphate ABC transporter permease ThiP [Hahella sp. HNIBRBA332]